MFSDYNVLITGANGYIGSHVVQKLLEIGCNVIAIDLNNNYIDTRAKIINFDIFNDDVNKILDIYKPNICLHLAWQDGFIHNSEKHLISLPSHYKFIKDLINYGIEHIAIMGTMHEVGYWEGEIDDKTPTNPISLYGIAKNSLRQSIDILAKEKNIVFQWLRAFYIYGDDLRNKSVFTKIMSMEKEGKTEFPFTSGENKYDFISINELATQIAKTLLQTEITGIINCCTGNPVSLKDKVESYIQDNCFKIKPLYGAFQDRPYDSPEIWGNNEKIKIVLNNFTN